VGSEVENLELTGAGNINGTGNALNNVLLGNDGNNVLSSGAGDDTLIGGLGTIVVMLIWMWTFPQLRRVDKLSPDAGPVP